MSYASFWKRFMAYLIDTILIIVFMGVVLAIPWYMASSPQKDVSQVGVFSIAALIISLVGPWLYLALMESSSKQGSLGKMALGIKVTDLGGNRIDFGRASVRFLVKYIGLLVFIAGFWVDIFWVLGLLIYILDHLMAAFTGKKQALHDMVTGCLVVNKR